MGFRYGKLNTKEDFIALLKHIIFEIGVRKVVASQRNPEVPSNYQRVLIAPETRIDITLSGKKHLIFPNGNNIEDIFLSPGEIHYCPYMHWKLPVWDSSHEMSSVVLKKECIRITYIKYEHTNKSKDIPHAKNFYHSLLPIGDVGLSLIKDLDLILDSEYTYGLETDLVRGLLKVVMLELEKAQSYKSTKAHHTWLKINEYLQENFYYPINRASVANTFRLNSCHVSRLFAMEGDRSFSATLLHLRMQYAKSLLEQSSVSVKEIADQCGYLSSTTFISAFKNYFGVPPGRYRCHHQI